MGKLKAKPIIELMSEDGDVIDRIAISDDRISIDKKGIGQKYFYYCTIDCRKLVSKKDIVDIVMGGERYRLFNNIISFLIDENWIIK